MRSSGRRPGTGVHAITALIAFAAFAASFSLIAKRLDGSALTPPLAFLGFGGLLAVLGLPAGETDTVLGEDALHLVAEVALVVLLFLDAARIDAPALARRHVLPARMLLLGLPLALLLGTGLAAVLFPGWPLALAALAAALLLPTDIALGQAVVNDTRVPGDARRALTMEAGLNDGLALPLILLLAALVAPAAQAPEGGWLMFSVAQVTLGPLVGLAAGCAGGWALIAAQDRRWTSDTFEGVAALSMAGFAYLAATEIGGNGFIAAFTAGLGFGAVVKGRCAFVYEFTESEGQLLSWSAFFLVGLLLLPGALAHLDWAVAALILGALFVTRPLAIWLALAGTGTNAADRLFLGWFGPRGLATALFALVVGTQLGPETAEPLLHLAVNAVWISAALHGLSAGPAGRLYARHAGLG